MARFCIGDAICQNAEQGLEVSAARVSRSQTPLRPTRALNRLDGATVLPMLAVNLGHQKSVLVQNSEAAGQPARRCQKQP